jgi:SOS-response transcriptional repressor LexA/transcriptional regulator with XRE-family HTH domain
MREIRLRAFGARGKAEFARRLGIRPSTYQHYESTRVPPADLLAKAAALTGCDLHWLISGAGRSGPNSSEEPRYEEPIVKHVRELVARRPEAVRSLSAFLALIDPVESSAWLEASPAGPAIAAGAAAGEWEPHEEAIGDRPASLTAAAAMIPVVGGTAAGPAHFWRDLLESLPDREAWEHESDRRVQRLLAEWGERSQATAGRLLASPAGAPPVSRVALVQCSRPDESGIVEFLACPAPSVREALVAWRIDGDSMAPRYRDGDLVLVSPNHDAVDGHPCVAHQRGQIGANCKIFTRVGADVVLIPVNEGYASERFPASRLAWAHRVLYSVRLES